VTPGLLLLGSLDLSTFGRIGASARADTLQAHQRAADAVASAESMTLRAKGYY